MNIQKPEHFSTLAITQLSYVPLCILDIIIPVRYDLQLRTLCVLIITLRRCARGTVIGSSIGRRRCQHENGPIWIFRHLSEL